MLHLSNFFVAVRKKIMSSKFLHQLNQDKATFKKLQGHPTQSVPFQTAAMDRNMQVRFNLMRVFLTSGPIER